MATERIDLADGVSGPAKAAASAVSGLDRVVSSLKRNLGSLSGLDRVFSQLRSSAASAQGPIRGVEDQIAKLRSEAAKPIELKVTGGAGAGAGGAGGLSLGKLGGALIVARVLKEIGAEAYDLTKRGAELAIEMSNWRSSSLAMFTHLTGSRVAAEQLLDRAKAIGRVTGESTEGVVGRMQKLIDDGLSPKAAEKVLHAVADVAAVRGQAAGDKVQKIIEDLENKGVADKGFIKQAAKAGIDSQRIYEELAKRTHRSMEQVKADLKGGKISGDLAAAAVTSAAESRFGGAAKSKGDNDIFVLLGRINQGFRDLFDGVDLGPLKGAMKNVDTVLQGAGGAKLKGSISSFFGQLGHTLLDPFNGAAGQKRLELFAQAASTGLDKMTNALKEAAPFVTFLSDAFAALGKKDAEGITGLDRVVKLLDRLYTVSKLVMGLGSPGDLKALFGSVEATKGSAAKGPATADKEEEGGYAFQLGAKMREKFGSTKSVTSALGDIDTEGMGDEQKAAFGDAGDAMTDGLVNAVNAGRSRVVEACRESARGGADAARAELGIASPSKVFAAIGDYAMQGLAQGISANDRVASASAVAAAQTANAAAMGSPSGGSSSGGGGRSVTVNMSMAVHAADAAGGAAAGAAAAGPLEAAMRDALTRIVRELREAA